MTPKSKRKTTRTTGTTKTRTKKTTTTGTTTKTKTSTTSIPTESKARARGPKPSFVARPGVLPTELDHVWHPVGPAVHIRALRRDDFERELRFLERLSPHTLYLRAQYVASALPLKEIERLLDLDYVDRMAVAALITVDGEERIIGVSRYARIETSTRADCAIVVADEWNGWGLGTELMRTLARAAFARGYTEFEGTALAENRRFAEWARRFGFDVQTEPHSGGQLHIRLRLNDLVGRT